jgi:signal peptidase I
MRSEKALCVRFGKHRNLQPLTVKKNVVLSRGLSTMALVLLLLQVMPCLAGGSSSEYMCLNCVGGSMYPTIKEGDMVQVKTNVDPASLQVGDIIVYGSIAAIAYIPSPKAICICHRIVEKHDEGGTWHFRTKGDNNSEVDPWDVPDYWLLGLVVHIVHVEPTSGSPTVAPDSPEPLEPKNVSSPQAPLQIPAETIIVSLIVCITVAAFIKLRSRKRLAMLRKTLVHSCFSCDYFRPQTIYELKRTNGRLGIQKRTDLTRGLCALRKVAITSILVEPTCKAYKSRTPYSILCNVIQKQSIQPLASELCPRCCSPDISLLSFDREREKYSCADCSYKWVEPRK